MALNLEIVTIIIHKLKINHPQNLINLVFFKLKKKFIHAISINSRIIVPWVTPIAH